MPIIRGNRLGLAKNLRSHTRQKLSAQTGIAENTLLRYENALAAACPREHLDKLAVALDVTPAWLAGLTESPK